MDFGVMGRDFFEVKAQPILVKNKFP